MAKAWIFVQPNVIRLFSHFYTNLNQMFDAKLQSLTKLANLTTICINKYSNSATYIPKHIWRSRYL